MLKFPVEHRQGVFEAHELRDEDKSRVWWKRCLKAVANVNEKIAPELEGMDAFDQMAIDRAIRFRWISQ